MKARANDSQKVGIIFPIN